MQKTNAAEKVEMKSYLSLILAIIALHCIVFAFILQSRVPIVLAVLDSLAAVVIGIRTNDTVGHSGVVIGILALLVGGLLLFS